MKPGVCQDGSGRVFGSAPKFSQECCQIIDGAARLGMRWIQHTALRKKSGKILQWLLSQPWSAGVPHRDTFEAFNIQETSTLLLQSWFQDYCTALNGFTLQERERCLFQDLLRCYFFLISEWKPYIFISLLRISQCWMLFEWSWNSWKKTNVFSNGSSIN